MADTKISALTELAAVPADTDVMAIVDATVSKKITFANLVRTGTMTLTNKTLTSPTLTTPALGTPASGVLTNCTGLPESGLADNAVTLAKMAHGTDGNLITYDATGAPAAVATGTSGQVLTSNGAGAAPTFQAAAGGTNSIYFGGGMHVDNQSSTSACFHSLSTYGVTNGTSETNNAQRSFNELTFTDLGVLIVVNTKATNSSAAFRDDAADVTGSSITITASTTGWFEATGASATIAAGSEICYRLTGTASGDISPRCWLARLTE